MKVNQIIEMDIVMDETIIRIQSGNFVSIASGKWFKDNVLEYVDYEVEEFNWYDNEIDIYVK